MRRPKSLAVRLFCAASVLFCAMEANQIVTAADPPHRPVRQKEMPGAQEPPRLVRVYLVDDLLFIPSDYPLQGSLPGASPVDKSDSRSSLSGFAPRAGAGTGMAGVIRGGKMPEDMGFGGMGMGGPGGGPLVGNTRRSQLINLVTMFIKGDWGAGRESPDQCLIFGNNLVVRQTEEGQHQIGNLLEALRSGSAAHSVTVEATWVWMDAQKREAFRTTLDLKRSRELVREAAAFRGEIRCLNGQTVHFATGQRRVVSAGATPTVGVGASAYSPRIEVVNVGATLQVTPLVSRQRRSAFLDLHSVVTQWGKPGDPIKVTSQSFSGSSEKSSNGTLVHEMTTVDRVNLGTQEWSTTADLPLEVPVLVGAVTVNAPGEVPANPADAKRPELALIVEIRAGY